MHRQVNLKILGAGGISIASIAVDAEALPALEQHLSDFAEHNPGLAQEEIVYTLLFKSEQDKNRLLLELEKETGLHIERREKESVAGEILTPREEEVLELLARGLAYKQIADALCISEGTVNSHINNIYRKLHVNNKMEAVGKRERKEPE
jgi:DNA-binding CsgD family transcriptional regulator